MNDIIRKSIGALMLLIAVYLVYFSSEDISGMYFKLTVFGCGGYYSYKPVLLNLMIAIGFFNLIPNHQIKSNGGISLYKLKMLCIDKLFH